MVNSQQLAGRLQEALAHQQGGRLDRAEAIFRQVAAIAPKLPLVFELWGQLAERQGRMPEALRCYGQAFRNDERSAQVLARLAQGYLTLGRGEEAEKLTRRFVEQNPKNAAGWNTYGYVLKVRGRVPEAIAAHETAVKLDPKYVDGWAHYGLTLGIVGRTALALEKFERALALDPHSPAARYGRAETLHKAYRLEDALADYETLLREHPGHLEARSYRLFALQNLDSMPRAALFEEHRAYGRLLPAGPASLPGYDLSPDRRLRVGIVSPDLRTHACAFFLEPLIRNLDRNQFELFLYHDHFIDDPMTTRLKGYATGWRKIVGQSNAVIEAVLRADRLDIAIDLTGHVGTTIRLPVFAKRIAPVQITYLGYPDTTGVPAMDYRFTDAEVDPIGEADAYATEKLVRFSPVAWCYQPPQDAPAVAPPPCLASGYVTFGCFNSPTKFTDRALRAWAAILQRVPGSRLRLKGRDFEEPAVRERLLRRFTAAGLPAERLELMPRTDGVIEHLGQYALVDVALDTFHYTGTTTTCEALWMGRPVVTLCEQRHAARVSASLLRAVGRPQWIADSVDAYVDLAVSLARDGAALAAETGGLREAVHRSPLCDQKSQSQRFAHALRECWREKCAKVG